MLTNVTSYVVCIIILDVNSMAANIILDQFFVFCRNVEKQEQLWKFSLDCLKDYITEEDLNNLGAKT